MPGWRTYRSARRKIAALMHSGRRRHLTGRGRRPLPRDQGDYTRAKFGVTATMLWLRREIRTGPRRRRVQYAADLEQMEVLEDKVNEVLGLTA